MNKKLPNLDDNYLGLRISDGAGAFIAGFAFLYLFQIFLVIISSIAKIDLSNGLLNVPIWFIYVTMVINQVALVLSVILYGKVTNKPILRTSRIDRKLSPIQGLILPLIAVAGIVAFLPIANAFVMLVELITGAPVDAGFSIGTKWWEIILSVVFIAVLPAIGEEILFRGAVARGLKRKSYLFAIVMSGFLFSLFHGSAAQTVHQFLIGMVFAYVYFVSGSLLASMVLHFCNNALAIFFEVILNQTGVGTAITMSAGATAGLFIGMTIVGVIALYFLLRWFMAESKKQAHIVDVDKEKYAFAKDLSCIFTKKGRLKLNTAIGDLFNDPDDNVNINDDIEGIDDAQMDDSLKQMLAQHKKLTLHKRKRYDMIVLGIAIGIVSFVWVLNLIVASV